MIDITKAISQMLVMFEELRFSKPNTSERVKIWHIVLSKQNATPAEIEQMAALGITTLKDFPVPSEGLELLRKVREGNMQHKLGTLIKASAELGYTVLTTPDQVHDGEWVGLGGNGVPLDELEAIRAERRLPTRSNAPALTVRARLKALKALAASNPIEMDGGE